MMTDDAVLTADGYPAEAALARITAWPTETRADFVNLLAYVRAIWHCADWGWSEPGPGRYEISTGGWSGNESLIEALQTHPLCWAFCWESSRRGGHYVFVIRLQAKAGATTAITPESEVVP